MAPTLPLTLLGTALRWRRAGQRWSVTNTRQLQAPETVLVESSSFGAGGAIPFSHAGTGVGSNSSPALAFSNLPEGTAQLLLIIEDVDVPLPRPLLHTIALIGTGVTSLDEGALDEGNDAIRFVPAAFGHRGYQGPRALPGHGPHRYGFHVFALDRAIPKDAALADLAGLLPWVDGQILGRGSLVGTQQR
jgi:phosphatidylethanolamine-binding protein (PEBP) family uncharacterized protein